jgi:DNA-binding GntR family transcriptional regulator
MEKLKELALALKAEGSDPLRRIELDSDWHAALIEDSGNRHLMRILADLKRILLRYEYAFMQDESLVAESAAEHEAIAQALASGDRKKAVRLLAAHWSRCSEATLSDFLANKRVTA